MDLGQEKLQEGLERFIKLPKPWRMGALGGLAALVVVLYVYALFLPANSELGALHARELEVQLRLNEVRAVANNLHKFEDEVGKLEHELAVALRQLPNSKELPVLLTDISGLGKNAGLEFKSFRPRSEIPRDFYAEVPIDIEFSGGFHEIATFFDQMSKLPRIVNVSELKMTIAKEGTADTRLLVTGSATTFRFIEAAGGSAVPAPAGKGAGAAPVAKPVAKEGEA
jgi:type IV pilus assembly protein PilO